jgi:hypothetical protein
MRVRAQSPTGDYLFGQNSANFYVNNAACVAQLILTRLKLFAGEWFLDIVAGVPYGGFPLNSNVIAEGTILANKYNGTQDLAIQAVILATPGVSEISAYSREYDSATRAFTVDATVITIFGAVQVAGSTTGTGGFELDVSPLDGTAGLG